MAMAGILCGSMYCLGDYVVIHLPAGLLHHYNVPRGICGLGAHFTSCYYCLGIYYFINYNCLGAHCSLVHILFLWWSYVSTVDHNMRQRFAKIHLIQDPPLWVQKLKHTFHQFHKLTAWGLKLPAVHWYLRSVECPRVLMSSSISSILHRLADSRPHDWPALSTVALCSYVKWQAVSYLHDNWLK